MYLIEAFAVTVLALIPAFVKFKQTDNNEDRRIIVICGIVLLLINWGIFYVACGSVAYLPVSIFSIILLVEGWLCFALSMTGADDFSAATLTCIAPIVFTVIVVFGSINGCEITNAAEYAALAGPIESKNTKQWATDNQPVDQNNIRLVPESLAIANAKLVMNNNGNAIGSSFEIDEQYVTLQKIRNKYYYLIPLGYTSFGRWSSLNCIDAYIRVSATDPYAKAELVTGQKMRYSSSAYFSQNLSRHINLEYPTYGVIDIQFEADDNDQVYWIATLIKPTLGGSGPKIKKVLLIDPESGDIKSKSLDELPSWIDRAIPENITKFYLKCWGDLKNGWWNSVWTGENLLEPESPVLNYTTDGRCVFVTPMTSSNSNDSTMIGIVYTDARTGSNVLYKVAGGATEEAIKTAVNAAVAYKQWHASEQMVYENILGNLSALVPILSQGGNYQGLAIVETQNKRVAVGDTPQSALREFERIISSSTGLSETEAAAKEISIISPVSRVGWDLTQSGKQYLLVLTNSKLVFSGTGNIISLTKEGDTVRISYMSNAKTVAPILTIHNYALPVSQ